MGCGESRSYEMVRELSTRLPKVADAEEVQSWLKHELALHSEELTNRPATIDVQALPGWLYDLDVLHQPQVTLVLDEDKTNDHLAVLWARQGDQVGILIGRASFSPAGEQRDSYKIQSSPGVFIWCPK
jgi:hypothetical protein